MQIYSKLCDNATLKLTWMHTYLHTILTLKNKNTKYNSN